MHAFTNYSNYSRNKLTLESIISQKNTDVQETTKVGSSRIHSSNSKCIKANDTVNTQLLFLLSKHTRTPLGSPSSVFSKYLQAEPNASLFVSLQMGFYPRRTKLKNITPSTSLIRLFKLNCYHHP